MTLSFLRPAALIALTLAGLAGCGGKADYEIAGTVSDLKYPGLVLTDTISGASITLSADQTRFVFPNTIEYGTEFNVVIRTEPSGQPQHQTCSPDARTNSDTAGRRPAIDILIACTVNQYAVGGTVTKATGVTGSFAGLKLINGSNDANAIEILAPTAPATSATYSYAGIPYATPYGITIFKQPTDDSVVCRLVPTAPKKGDTADKVAGEVGDDNVVINVICEKAPPKVPVAGA